MTARVTDLGEARAEKTPPCDYCGEPEHKGAFQCKRIKSIKFDNENDIIHVYLHPEGVTVPVAARGG
jgi:tRNA(Ile2) C34 agmatinyltransferase TiaS